MNDKKPWPYEQPPGLVPKFEPLEDFEEFGEVCPWSHCVCLFPLDLDEGPMACPIFGRCCPAGVQQAIECDDLHRRGII